MLILFGSLKFREEKIKFILLLTKKKKKSKLCIWHIYSGGTTMALLRLKNVSKKYEKFYLDNISFSLESGFIMGFIGRNGAGKTTTLKAILGLISIDDGSVELFDEDASMNQLENKQKIGIIFGGSDYYPNHKLKVITKTYRTFYRNWDQKKYQEYLDLFKLDEDKRIKDLSEGMKVKYSLALALSHGAKLLILDEPTSGLDPISRDELLEIFQSIIEQGDVSILFSTQIVSDIEKCADYITYIKNGKLVCCVESQEFIEKYRIVKGIPTQLDQIKNKLISYKKSSFGFEGLMDVKDIPKIGDYIIEKGSIEEIMIHYERRMINE